MTLTALLQSLSIAFAMTVRLFICLASWPLPVPGGGHFGADRQSLSVDLISVSSGSCFLARRLMLLTLVINKRLVFKSCLLFVSRPSSLVYVPKGYLTPPIGRGNVI